MDKGFTFFESYDKAFNELTDAEQLSLLNAMRDYAFRDIEAEGLSPKAKIAFIIMRPSIDSSIKKRRDGAGGGNTKGENSKQKRVLNSTVNTTLNSTLNSTVNTTLDSTRQDKTRQDKTRQRQDETGEDGGDTLPSENPFSDSYVQSDGDPLVSYAADNIRNLSGDSMGELLSYRDQLPDDVIRLAINIACDNGAPRFSYVRRILEGYVEQGIHSVADAKASNEQFRQSHSKATDDDPRAREDQWF